MHSDHHQDIKFKITKEKDKPRQVEVNPGQNPAVRLRMLQSYKTSYNFLINITKNNKLVEFTVFPTKTVLRPAALRYDQREEARHRPSARAPNPFRLNLRYLRKF